MQGVLAAVLEAVEVAVVEPVNEVGDPPDVESSFLPRYVWPKGIPVIASIGIGGWRGELVLVSKMRTLYSALSVECQQPTECALPHLASLVFPIKLGINMTIWTPGGVGILSLSHLEVKAAARGRDGRGGGGKGKVRMDKRRWQLGGAFSLHHTT